MKNVRSVVTAALAAGLLTLIPARSEAQFHLGLETPEERSVPAGAIEEGTYRRLERIYEQIGEEEWAEAYDALMSLRDRVERVDFERATVDQLLGHVHMAQDQFDQAIAAFERAIDADVLQNSVQFDMMFAVAQLYLTEEKYDETIDMLRRYVANATKPNENAWVIVATIYAERNQFQRVLDNIDYAISLHGERKPEEEPREDWFKTKLYAHFELEQFPQAAEVLEYLIRRSPENDDYWVQLSQLYLQMENEDRALGILALAERQGFLEKDTQWLQLANMYSLKEVPYMAAQILQQGLERGIIDSTGKHWEQLANSWAAAKELDNALVAYERAGTFMEDGQLDLQRAFILFDMDRYQEAADAAALAVNKGDLRRPGEAYMLIGTAHFELENWEEALAAMQDARQFERQRSSASQWIRYIRDAQNRG
jgi:tetratricopeptide (TPR) repeat protein